MEKPKVKNLTDYHIVYHEGRRNPWTIEHFETKKVYAAFDQEELARKLLAKGQEEKR